MFVYDGCYCSCYLSQGKFFIMQAEQTGPFYVILNRQGQKDYFFIFLFQFNLYTIMSTTRIEDYYSQNKTKFGEFWFQPYFLLPSSFKTLTWTSSFLKMLIYLRHINYSYRNYVPCKDYLMYTYRQNG